MNKYPAPCACCTRIVLPGKGILTKTPGGWSVTHTNCALAKLRESRAVASAVAHV